MPASYPSSIKTFTAKVDAVDYPQAVHVNDLQDEVNAIETELGTAPKTIDDTTAPGASPASVAVYLDMIANQIKAITGKANWYTAPVASLETGFLRLAGGTMTGALVAAVGSVSAPGVSFAGDLDTGIYRVSAGVIGLAADGADVARFLAVASAVNRIEFKPATTGNPAIVASEGSDTNAGLGLWPKGTGKVEIKANPLLLAADPSAALDAATKQYVDAASVVMTTRAGSAAGDYTTTSASDVDVDGTNLAYTVSPASGKKVFIIATVSVLHSSTVAVTVVLADGTTALAETEAIPTTTRSVPTTVSYVFTGDGSSHTFKLRWRTASATATMHNSTAVNAPRLLFVGA